MARIVGGGDERRREWRTTIPERTNLTTKSTTGSTVLQLPLWYGDQSNSGGRRQPDCVASSPLSPNPHRGFLTVSSRPIVHAPHPQKSASVRISPGLELLSSPEERDKVPRETTTTMLAEKTPTSALTGTYKLSLAALPTHCCVAVGELFVNKLWYRSIAKIKWLLFGGTPETSTTRSSPITKLPQELVGMIVSYFIYDTSTLLACSLTSHSWYIAAVPHLHHTLTTDDLWRIHFDNRKCRWPGPLRKSYNLGLLPLVKRFRIRRPLNNSLPKLTPRRLGTSNLRYFSALTNLQELGIDNLHVSSFMPTIQQCFGHFSPTLRFLALREPTGSSRQILYFIGLFPNLQDLKLHYFLPADEQESTDDEMLVPLSIPPLQGRLTLTCFTRENLVEDMIALFGGLRFRYMDLFRVKCVPLLLGACAETLETLRLYPTDPYGEGFLEKRGET